MALIHVHNLPHAVNSIITITITMVCAVVKGRVRFVQVLENSTANSAGADRWNTTPLHHACTHERLDIALMLLNAGADPLRKNMVCPLSWLSHNYRTENVHWITFQTKSR